MQQSGLTAKRALSRLSHPLVISIRSAVSLTSTQIQWFYLLHLMRGRLIPCSRCQCQMLTIRNHRSLPGGGLQLGLVDACLTSSVVLGVGALQRRVLAGLMVRFRKWTRLGVGLGLLFWAVHSALTPMNYLGVC